MFLAKLLLVYGENCSTLRRKMDLVKADISKLNLKEKIPELGFRLFDVFQ